MSALQIITNTTNDDPIITPHRCVVLFYKYFIEEHSSLSTPILHENVLTFLRSLCETLGMKGRILVATEGINGTLSASDQTKMQDFIREMENFDVSPFIETQSSSGSECEQQKKKHTNSHPQPNSPSTTMNLFQNIDWKFSSITNTIAISKSEPFPDLKIAVVNEIVGSGHAIPVDDIPKFGGAHLTPEEFHAVIEQGWSSSSRSSFDDGNTKHTISASNKDEDGNNVDDNHVKQPKELVVIDVRNHFEHAIGHFVHSSSSANTTTTSNNNNSIINQKNKMAINPKMGTFASFDTSFCKTNAESLKDKKVLLYCTGGIRCEKASAMLRKRGVEDVSQLSGGIHRYLERFGSDGFFKGKNFVFDQRVAIDPEDVVNRDDEGDGGVCDAVNKDTNWIVGKCLECTASFDEISGSRLCTICRDLVLICPKCQNNLREFHCQRHSSWKKCYYTFLEPYDENELIVQKEALIILRDENDSKNTRRTLLRQIHKIQDRITLLKSGEKSHDRNAPRRCRTCHLTNTLCDGLCWGFWRRSGREPYKTPISL